MQISSRLRRLIMIFLGFLIMLFGKLVEEAGTFRSLSQASFRRKLATAGWTLKAANLNGASR